jgi:hypothetical protein
MSKEIEMETRNLMDCMHFGDGDETCKKLVLTKEIANNSDMFGVPNWFFAAKLGYKDTVIEALKLGVDKNMRVLYNKKEINVIGYLQYLLVVPSYLDNEFIVRTLDMILFLIDQGVTPPADLYDSIMTSALSKTEPIYKPIIPNYMKFLQLLRPAAGGRRKSKKNRKNRSKRTRRN